MVLMLDFAIWLEIIGCYRPALAGVYEFLTVSHCASFFCFAMLCRLCFLCQEY